MSTEDNKAAMRSTFETLNQRNLAAIVEGELWQPDLVVHDPNNPDVHNYEEYKQFLTASMTAFPGQLTIEDMIAEGDKVVVRFTYRGSHQGQWRGAPPTGKAVMFTSTQTYRMVNGKTAEIWANTDVFSLVQQLGVIPTPGPAS